MALTPTDRARGAIDVNLITGYDETNDWQKISIANDAVGITKESTLNSIKLQTDNLTFDANSFLKISSHHEKVTQQPLVATSIAGGATQNVDLTIPPGKTGIAVSLKTAYDASATDGVRLDALHSPDGTNYDTDTDDTIIHPFAAGTTKQKTYTILGVHPYIRLAIVNLDETYATTADLWVTYI